MEFLIELILTFFLDGSFEIIQEKKIPKWIRTVVLIIITIFYSAFIGFFVYLSVKSNHSFVKSITAMLSILFIVLFGRFWYKLIKEYRKSI